MRDYKNLDLFYSELLNDVYRQPEDPSTTAMALEVIQKWVSKITTCTSVLDVGCGEGFLQPAFESFGIRYTGIAMGEDVLAAQVKGRYVLNMDFNFLEFPDRSFDMVFSRHSLEHSPFPLLSLMEWHRVAKHWLCLIVPKPEHFGWDKPNHYGITTKVMSVTWMERAGWHPVWYDENDQEHRFMCDKKHRMYSSEEIINLEGG